MEYEKVSHPPKIGELWVYTNKHNKENVVQIDYLDEDVIWFSYLETEAEDDWCGLEYFMFRARRYD